MQETPPLSLIALALVAALLAGWLAWNHGAQLHRAGRRLDFWSWVELGAGVFLMVAMLLSTASQVVVRYALAGHVDMPWTEEFARLMLVWAAMWGATMLQRSGDHIAMSVVVDQMPAALQRQFDVLADVVALAVLGVIAWYGWLTSARLLTMHTASLGLPISAFVYAVAIAATVMIVHTMRNLVARLRGRALPHRPDGGL